MAKVISFVDDAWVQYLYYTDATQQTEMIRLSAVKLYYN